MLSITHIAVTLLLILIMKLDRNESLVALLFGVFIDLDHLLAVPDFIMKEGIKNITNVDSMLAADVHWKSAMHSPVAIMIVAPASVAFRMAIPMVFWSVHIAMDFVQEEYLGISSLPELALFAFCVGTLGWLEYGIYRSQEYAKYTSFKKFLTWEGRRIVDLVDELSPRRWKRAFPY